MFRLSASSPHVLKALSKDRHRDYAESVKPFNFLISPHVTPLGHPPGVDPKQFHPIAPYTRDARQWTKIRWTDVYSGDSFRITTRATPSSNRTARVQSYGEVIDRYRVHPEAKSMGSDGIPCIKRTVGLLQRRPVTLGELVHIGKETNRLEEVEQGLVHAWKEVQLVFPEPQHHIQTVTPCPDEDPKMERACQECGTAVLGNRRQFCSSACRQCAYRHRTREMLTTDILVAQED